MKEILKIGNLLNIGKVNIPENFNFNMNGYMLSAVGIGACTYLLKEYKNYMTEKMKLQHEENLQQMQQPQQQMHLHVVKNNQKLL